jgi:hypothetical protein
VAGRSKQIPANQNEPGSKQTQTQIKTDDVIPTQVGIHACSMRDTDKWIPTCVGMTDPDDK